MPPHSFSCWDRQEGWGPRRRHPTSTQSRGSKGHSKTCQEARKWGWGHTRLLSRQSPLDAGRPWARQVPFPCRLPGQDLCFHFLLHRNAQNKRRGPRQRTGKGEADTGILSSDKGGATDGLGAPRPQLQQLLLICGEMPQAVGHAGLGQCPKVTHTSVPAPARAPTGTGSKRQPCAPLKKQNPISAQSCRPGAILCLLLIYEAHHVYSAEGPVLYQ